MRLELNSFTGEVFIEASLDEDTVFPLDCVQFAVECTVVTLMNLSGSICE
jgi:hypothetical protein